jgi:hypothetical protein
VEVRVGVFVGVTVLLGVTEGVGNSKVKFWGDPIKETA